MIHFHVYEQARTRARGSVNPQATHAEIGHPVRTPEQASARVKEFRQERGDYYAITHSGPCPCPNPGHVEEVVTPCE